MISVEELRMKTKEGMNVGKNEILGYLEEITPMLERQFLQAAAKGEYGIHFNFHFSEITSKQIEPECFKNVIDQFFKEKDFIIRGTLSSSFYQTYISWDEVNVR